jgi:hypothetical protein
VTADAGVFSALRTPSALRRFLGLSMRSCPAHGKTALVSYYLGRQARIVKASLPDKAIVPTCEP